MIEPEAEITDAVILMAGAGSRLVGAAGGLAKPLVQVAGQPLIAHTLAALQRAGVRDVHAVLGANSEFLAREVHALMPKPMRFHAVVNPDWKKQNGVSVLCAAGRVKPPFFLTMGDHLFEFGVLEALVAEGDRAQINLAVDRNIESIFDLEDATKVRTEHGRIVGIGKELSVYDAIDTGVFLCSSSIFDFLKRARNDGDCSLSDGIRLAGSEGKARAIEIGDAWWQDVDTPEMLARAEQQSARLLRQSGRGLAEESVARQR